MPSSISDLETLCTDQETDLESVSIFIESPGPQPISEPDQFGLWDDYLIHFSDEHFDQYSTEALSSNIEGPQKRIAQDAQLRELDEIQKSRKVENGSQVRVRRVANKKQTRARLGQVFSDFLKEYAQQDIDDFLTSLSRDFVKKISFCVKAETIGFEEAFRAAQKLHDRGTKNVRVPASDRSRPLYERLFSAYLSLSSEMREVPRSYDRSLSRIKKQKHYKSFNVAFQKYFYAPKAIRILFKHYLDFLDGYAVEGRGVHLTTELRISRQDPEVVRSMMVHEYMHALELKAYDGLTEASIFRVLAEAD